MKPDGPSAGRLSPLNALRAVIALLAIAGVVIIALHVLQVGKPKPRAQATAAHTTAQASPAPATIAQVLAAAKTRVRKLRGRSVREHYVTTMSMSTPQVSETATQTATMDLAGARGRIVVVELTRRNVAWQAVHASRDRYEYLTIDGGTTTYTRFIGHRWTRTGGGVDRWLFVPPQNGLLPDPDRSKLAGHALLGAVDCVLVETPMTARQATIMLDTFGDYQMKPPKKVERSGHGAVTLWIDTSDWMVLRQVAVVQADGQAGSWRYYSVEDLSRWGDPVVPAIVLPKSL